MNKGWMDQLFSKEVLDIRIRFFDKVLVMHPDEKIRNNRLALVKGMSDLYSKIADFSKIRV
jgi:glycyl-tRNA synthetase beta subunit